MTAKKDDVNYELAESLLDCDKLSHICASSQDKLYLLIEAIVTGSELAGKTLLFELTAALKYYPTAPSITYQVNVVGEELSKDKQTTELTRVYKSENYTYYIGI